MDSGPVKGVVFSFLSTLFLISLYSCLALSPAYVIHVAGLAAGNCYILWLKLHTSQTYLCIRESWKYWNKRGLPEVMDLAKSSRIKWRNTTPFVFWQKFWLDISRFLWLWWKYPGHPKHTNTYWRMRDGVWQISAVGIQRFYVQRYFIDFNRFSV